MLNHLPAMRETWVWSLGREDPWEKEMATHSSILAWEIPWMEEPGDLQPTGSQRVRHDWATSLSLSLTSLGNFISSKRLLCISNQLPRSLQKFAKASRDLFIFTAVCLLYNVVSFRHIAKWISYVCTYIPAFWGVSFPIRLPQSTEQSSLCYTIGSHIIYFMRCLSAFWLRSSVVSTLYIVVYTWISQFLPPPSLPPLVSIHLFSMSVSLFLLFK